jgi:hypothetical protein
MPFSQTDLSRSRLPASGRRPPTLGRAFTAPLVRDGRRESPRALIRSRRIHFHRIGKWRRRDARKRATAVPLPDTTAPKSMPRGAPFVALEAFKKCFTGRCFRCLASDHQVAKCRDPFRRISCRRWGIFPAPAQLAVLAPSPTNSAPASSFRLKGSTAASSFPHSRTVLIPPSPSSPWRSSLDLPTSAQFAAASMSCPRRQCTMRQTGSGRMLQSSPRR